MTELSNEVMSSLIEVVYRAGLGATPWDDVVDRIASLFDGAAVSLQGHDFATNKHLGVMTAGFDPDAVASFQAHYATVNPWASGMARWPVGTAMVSDTLLSREDLQRTEFFNEWLRPQALVMGVGVIAYRSRLRFLALAANVRARDEERFSAPMQQVFQLLGPHLNQAFQMSRLVSNSEICARRSDILRRLPVPTFLIDSAGRIYDENEAGQNFRRQLNRYFDRQLRVLRFLDPAADDHFSCALNSIQRGEYAALEPLFRVRNSTGQSARALLVPLLAGRAEDAGFLGFLLEDQPIALLTISEEVPQIDERHKAYVSLGFTAAESALAGALLGGFSLNEYADSRRLSVHTVRNQLRSLFQKAGVRRQGELIAMLARHDGRT
ncbi:helix-turn-helix transcriptional regulator [Devosia nitrariae]|uniref:HTH luxR-type domain-containing protein n=1 Tax=Devosia nitrariae TaxID=2071872 RepID=A0ABQ5W1S2_9HYPH|nr:hypothetical protein [Devosia nitrariae]GLQ53771.1 hypothetical protein GCM10010862_10300 [Devosia nitrariae]